MPLYQTCCHAHPEPYRGNTHTDTPQEAARLFADAHRRWHHCDTSEVTVQALEGEQLLFHVHLPTGQVTVIAANEEPLLGEGDVTDRESASVPYGTLAAPLAPHHRYEARRHPLTPECGHVVELNADNQVTRRTRWMDADETDDPHGNPLSAEQLFAYALATGAVEAPGPRQDHTYEYWPGSHQRPIDRPHYDDDPTLGARLHVVERDRADRITRYTDPFDQADMFDPDGNQLTAAGAFAEMAATGLIHTREHGTHAANG